MKASNTILITAVSLAAGLLSAGNASAVTQTRQFATNPTGICQGALPAFETAIRKRPLAVQNEGETNSFVTCSFTSQGNFGANPSNPTGVTMYLNTSGGAAVSVTCTGVSGYQGGANQYITKTATLAATGTQSTFAWSSADFTGAPAIFPSGLFSVSCALPPGVAINDSYVTFVEDVGT